MQLSNMTSADWTASCHALQPMWWSCCTFEHLNRLGFELAATQDIASPTSSHAQACLYSTSPSILHT